MKELSVWTGPADDHEIPLITAYFDESGHSSSSRVVAIGGAIGPPSSWTKVREHWSAILLKYGVKVFHMADFENRYGEFTGWGEERRRSLLADLLSILDTAFVIPIGTAVVVDDFRKLKPDARRGLIDPVYLCFQMCIYDVAQTVLLVKEDLADPRLRAVFFEKQREFFKGPIFFAQMLNHESYSGRLGLLGFASKQASVKLHLADLIAYELRKHVENCFFDPGRPTRWPMQQLLKRPFVANCFDTKGRSIRNENSEMAFFRNADTSQLNQRGKILLGRNLLENERKIEG